MHGIKCAGAAGAFLKAGKAGIVKICSSTKSIVAGGIYYTVICFVECDMQNEIPI